MVTIKRIVLWALIALLLVWHADGLRKAKDAGMIPLYDFAEYWAASRIFLSGGNPYDPVEMLAIQRSIGWTDSKPIMMWNPPWTLPLLLPFAVLPYWNGRALWFLLNLAAVLLCADWFWRQFGGPGPRRWISWIAPLLFIPVGTSLFLGQISPLVFAGIAGFMWGLAKRRMITAGAFTLLLALKPHLLYLFWLFLILWIAKERRWKVFVGAAASLLGSCLMVAAINPASFHNYYHSITSASGPQVWQTPTWGVALIMLFPAAGSWVRFIPSAVGIMLAYWLWRSWQPGFDWLRQLPTILLLSVTTSSFTWMFDWVSLLPVVILALFWFNLQPRRLWWLLAALVVMQPLLVFSPAVSHTNFFTIWLPPALWLMYWAGHRSQQSVESADTVLP